MFEITVIERYPSGGSVISHIPVTDEAVETTVEGLVDNENRCVNAGVLTHYTILACFEQFNRPEFYCPPKTLGVKP